MKTLSDMTENVVQMIFIGIGGAALIFVGVIIVLYMLGMRGKTLDLGKGIAGLAALGWLYIAYKANFFL